MARRKIIDGKQVCLNLSKGLLKRLDERARSDGISRSRVAEKLLNAQLQAEKIDADEIRKVFQERIAARRREGGFSYQETKPTSAEDN